MSTDSAATPGIPDDTGFWQNLIRRIKHPIAVVHEGALIYHNTGDDPRTLPDSSPFRAILGEIAGDEPLPDMIEMPSQNGRIATVQRFSYKDRDYILLSSDEHGAGEAIARCDTRMREIAHRAKNSISTIMSLLTLQESSISSEEGKDALRKSRERAHAIMKTYESLSVSGKMDALRLDVLLRPIAAELASAYAAAGMPASLDFELAELTIPAAKAIPVTLIANELVTNALKHAFGGMSGGRISMALASDGTRISLTVSDNGKGFPEGFAPSKAPTLGFSIVHALAAQVRGTLEVLPAKGASIRLSFDANNA